MNLKEWHIAVMMYGMFIITIVWSITIAINGKKELELQNNAKVHEVIEPEVTVPLNEYDPAVNEMVVERDRKAEACMKTVDDERQRLLDLQDERMQELQKRVESCWIN